jgi:hypothetical protein
LNQLMDGDIVYVRDFRNLEGMDVRRIKAMGIIAHACYESWDLAYFCLEHLVGRGELPQESRALYLGVVNRILASRT